MFARRLAVLGLALSSVPALSGCSKQADSSTHLPGFNDISAAPPAIRTAARAVVRIRTAGESATGSFISADGLLLTNNHVLGVAVCAREGCSAQITSMHQRGQSPQQPVTLFAVPVAVDVGLDMAVVQLHEGSSTGANVASPDYLAIDARDPAALEGMKVTIVGHPEGHLKKWTSGNVVDSFGSWFQSTAFILPGDSGSPVLSDAGTIVGLIHRGPTSQDLVTNDGVNVYSVGTASAPLVAAMGAALPSVMISTGAPTTEDAVIAHDRVYLNAHAPTALVGGVQVSVLSILAAACDKGLARTDFESPDDLSTAMTPCYDAMSWIECRADAAPAAYGQVCPTASDGAAWAARFQAINARSRAMNGELALSAISFGIASLATSKSAGQDAGGQSLLAALAEAQPPLDFTIANYLAAFGVASYDQAVTLDFVRGYQKVPHWEIAATSIASAALWLNHAQVLGGSEALSILATLAADPEVSVGSKLYIEEVQHASGAAP